MKNALVFVVLILSISSCKNEWQVIEFTHLDNELAESFLPAEYFTSNSIFYTTLDSLHELELEESVSFQSKNKFNYTADKFNLTATQRSGIFTNTTFTVESEVFYDTPTSSVQQLKFSRGNLIGNTLLIIIEVSGSDFVPGEDTEFQEEMILGDRVYNDVYFSNIPAQNIFVNQEFGVIGYELGVDTISLIGF